MIRKFLRQIPRSKYAPVALPGNSLRVLKTPSLALRSVISKDGLGVYASSDTLFKGAVFGRDSIEVAEDLLLVRPRLVRRIILTLASLQGQENNKAREEEAGKIIHEYRRAVVDGKKIKGTPKQIFEQLGKVWGGNEDELRYYGSVDATPHFVRLVGEYCNEYGEEILSRKIYLKNGEPVSLLTVVRNAINWLIQHLDNSKSGFVEYKRFNPRGIENQVWKDSKEFYVHENGLMANHSKPISSIEVQALAYDALIAGAILFRDIEQELICRAEKLQNHILQTLWLHKHNYFALGTDFDYKNRRRIIKTKTANPAALLDSKIFELLPDETKETYVSAIVREIMGTEFLTDAGIRSRALSEARLIPFWDYHGSYTSWPKETYTIARGLRKQRMFKLAEQLENRLLNVMKVLGSYPEFIYVDARGRILGTMLAARQHGEITLVDSRIKPEKIQAWTVSAYLAISAVKLEYPWGKRSQEQWQKNLEKEVLGAIPIVPRFKSGRELRARYPSYPYELKGQHS